MKQNFNFRKDDEGKVGFLVDNDKNKLKEALENFKHFTLNVYQLGTGQYFVETADVVKFNEVARKTHSDAYFVDRKTGRAMMFMLLNGLTIRERTIYLMDRKEPKNAIYTPQLLNRRIVENFVYANLEMDIFNPIPVKELYELKWNKFNEMFLKRLEKKDNKNKLSDANFLKRLGGEKKEKSIIEKGLIEHCF